MSTSTLLDVCNTGLRSVGERPILNLTGTLAQVCLDCVKQTARDVETTHRWEWLLSYIPALSWNNGVATLPDIQTLLGVSVGDTTGGYRELIQVPEERLARLDSFGYIGLSDSASLYSQPEFGTVRFQPYPNDAQSHSRIRFWVLESIVIPTLASETFPNIPERFIPLFTKKLGYHLAVRHLNDSQLASVFQGEFEQAVQNYRNRESSVSGRSLNLYPRRRVSFWG